MVRSLHVAMLLVVVLVVAGCQLRPDFPVDRLVFDEGLLGTWTRVGSDGNPVPDEAQAPVFRVLKQSVDASHGRTNPSQGMTPPPEDVSQVPAYSISMENLRLDDVAMNSPKQIVCDAYLVKVGDHRLLAAHVSYDQLAMSAPFPCAIPLLWFFRVEVDGETVVIRPPPERFRHGLVWLPAVEVRGSEEAVLPAPSVERQLQGPSPRGFLATTSIDQAIRYYELAGKRDDFWIADGWRFQRIKAAEPPSRGNGLERK